MEETQKQNFKPGNMLYPLPPVMVSVSTLDGKDNIITIAWAATVCTNPPMVSISVRPTRYSYELLKASNDFVINLTTEDLTYACDYCGVKSGREVDKFQTMNLTKQKADIVKAPLIAESPVNIECKIRQCLELGSHHMFIAEVVAVHVNTKLLDDKGKFHLNQSGLVAYSHGEYFLLGKNIGKFGYSIQKNGNVKNAEVQDKKKETNTKTSDIKFPNKSKENKHKDRKKYSSNKPKENEDKDRNKYPSNKPKENEDKDRNKYFSNRSNVNEDKDKKKYFSNRSNVNASKGKNKNNHRKYK